VRTNQRKDDSRPSFRHFWKLSNVVIPFTTRDFQTYVLRTKINKKFKTYLNSQLQLLFLAMLLSIMLPSGILPGNIQAEAQQPLLSLQEKLPDNIAFFSLDAFEYTFDIEGKQIFSNDTLKHSIVTEYNPSVYNIPTLHYTIMEHTINASDIVIHVTPTRIDEANTRLDFQIFANNAQVTGQLLSKSYNDLNITSAYGIYDRNTDKMTVHIPYSVALQHLVQ
jgi:hypothetical protein